MTETLRERSPGTGEPAAPPALHRGPTRRLFGIGELCTEFGITPRAVRFMKTKAARAAHQQHASTRRHTRLA
jgi:hypothetical protein